MRDPAPLFATIAVIVSVTAMAPVLLRSDLRHRGRSTLDPLTGLLDRTSLEQRLHELQEQAAQTGAAVTVVLAEIDHFKSINDRCGHQVGDAVLKEVAYTLRKSTREFELVYRLGGEEFLLLLPNADADTGALAAERLRTSVEHERPAGAQVTVSLGVAMGVGDRLDFDPSWPRLTRLCIAPRVPDDRDERNC